MKTRLPLPQNKKLTVVVRVEPGCLGPDGRDHIEEFCGFAQSAVAAVDADFVCWMIVPRYDKSLPETQYEVDSRKLSYEKASQYLRIFERDIDAFEVGLNERLSHLIEEYRGR